MNRRQFCLALAAPLAGRAMADAGVRVIDEIWTDRARNREVPVRLRLPANTARAPVILFSHGLGGSVAGGTRWGEVWSASGYIVVHMQHHGSDEALWKGQPVLAGFNNMRRAMTVENGMARAHDVRFVLDDIGRRRRAGDADLAIADLERIGMSGHSFGARTTLTMVSTLADARIRAAIALSPVGELTEAANRERSGRVAIPFLSITGTEDRVPILNDARPEDRLLPFRYMP